MYKHKFFELQNALELPTFISALSHSEYLCCSMSYNLSSACSIFCTNSNIVVALNPKPEESSSISHFLIGSRIFPKLFHIAHVTPYITAADSEQNIQKIGANNYTYRPSDVEEIHEANCSHNNSCHKNETDNCNCDMIGGILLNRNVLLREAGISNVKKHRSESVCDSFVAGHKGVRVQGRRLLHIGVHRHHVHLGIRC